MNHPLQTLLKTRTPDHPIGIPSLCSANEWVIDAGMLWAQKHQIPLLLEATANQVNQFGGYTGMTPQDFFNFVKQRALKNKFPLSSLFLGGDHLGPMVWKNETEESAMTKAETLVRDFIMAGFTKIHLDASMPLADDEITQGLDPSVVAIRAARLAAACEQAYRSLHAKNSRAVPPIYVVGSEVPIAGGAHDKEDTISVTTPKNFHEEVTLFQDAFEEHGLHEAWKRVIAVVVQPGVEFGNDTIMDYDAEAASALCHALDDYPGLVFEGHSTDYQRPEALHTMISNGVAILKVGPALTFALREGLYALQSMEKILFSDSPEKQSHYCEVLERVMRENPNYWKTYFDGPERMLSINRIFGLSDRSRYYLGNPEVKAAEEKLLHNLSQTDIPLGLLHQFLPDQYRKVRQNTLSTQPSALLLDKICALLDDYRQNEIQEARKWT